MILNCSKHCTKVEERNPLKQGLKLEVCHFLLFLHHVEERNPLKQGLKRIDENEHGELMDVEERNPLKQGLKLEGAGLLE